ncbi:MAG: PQQ-binding-like beta-propeller repeat protein, partial [Candidatus Acidiferrales bacterium]
MTRQKLLIVTMICAALAAGCSRRESRFADDEAATRARKAVDGARIIRADDEPGNWMTHGRTYSEQRFSPLKQINDTNVSRLGLAWFYDLDTRRGQEATPLVVDGVMYFTTAWSKVFALDAATGA